MPITVRIETDAVSATDAMGKSAEAFTHDTGIQVVVEKYGYKSSMEKATEDLVSRTGKCDVVVQNNQALGKFARLRNRSSASTNSKKRAAKRWISKTICFRTRGADSLGTGV
jgi:hypothetical protein